MSFPIARRRLLLTGAALGAAPRAMAQGRDGDVFEIPKHETTTIDGRQWETPMPGGMTVDAAHRSVLVRFPTAADDIADLLSRGRVMVRAELALGYGGYQSLAAGDPCGAAGRTPWNADPT